MLPSLSDKTKSYLAVSAVLAVALCNVVFGQNWTAGSAPQSQPQPQPAAALPAASDGPFAVAPIAPTTINALPAFNNAASAPIIEPAAPAPAEAPPPPQCDVDACSAAYRTFRASDCTYIPSAGVRRLCTKGAAADAAADDAAANAHADGDTPAVAHCHYRTCAEHYSSFNPGDCTYQPLDGPRRLCEK